MPPYIGYRMRNGSFLRALVPIPGSQLNGIFFLNIFFPKNRFANCTKSDTDVGLIPFVEQSKFKRNHRIK